MSYPYAPQLPRDAGGAPLQGLPAAKPALQTNVGVPVASSVVSFNANTTMIEIAAIGGQGAVLKWGSASVISDAGTANFDHFIPPDGFRRLVIPISSAGVFPSVVGLNSQAGLYSTMAVKAHSSSASVFSTQY